MEPHGVAASVFGFVVLGIFLIGIFMAFIIAVVQRQRRRGAFIDVVRATIQRGGEMEDGGQDLQ